VHEFARADKLPLSRRELLLRFLLGSEKHILSFAAAGEAS
jgi:hypothetical protein